VRTVIGDVWDLHFYYPKKATVPFA
jgi:hypothetical protein